MHFNIFYYICLVIGRWVLTRVDCFLRGRKHISHSVGYVSSHPRLTAIERHVHLTWKTRTTNEIRHMVVEKIVWRGKEKDMKIFKTNLFFFCPTAPMRLEIDTRWIYTFPHVDRVKWPVKPCLVTSTIQYDDPPSVQIVCMMLHLHVPKKIKKSMYDVPPIIDTQTFTVPPSSRQDPQFRKS